MLYLIPKAVVLGIGCKKGTTAEKIEKHVTQVLEDYGIFPEAVKLAASIDLKKEEPGLCTYCEKYGIPFQTFSKEELEQAEGTFTRSEFVKQTTGVDNVCERSAMCAGGEKISGTQDSARRSDSRCGSGKIGGWILNKVYVIGMGPGAYEQMTVAAVEALKSCDVIVGYTVYVDLMKNIFRKLRSSSWSKTIVRPRRFWMLPTR